MTVKNDEGFGSVPECYRIQFYFWVKAQVEFSLNSTLSPSHLIHPPFVIHPPR